MNTGLKRFILLPILMLVTSNVFAGPVINPEDPLSDVPSGQTSFGGDSSTIECPFGFVVDSNGSCIAEGGGWGGSGSVGGSGGNDPRECSQNDPNCSIKNLNRSTGTTDSSLGISSPFTNTTDAAFSKATVELQNNITTSELALANATMHMVEPAFAAAMSDTMKTSLGLSENRYLASMHTRNEIDHSGGAARAQGEIYESCVTEKIRSGKSFSEAQEVCLGGRNKAPEASGKFETIEPWSLKNHTAHPLYEDIAAGGGKPYQTNKVFYTLGDSSVQLSLLRNFNVTGGSSELRYSRENMPENFIMLSDIIFNPTLLELKKENNEPAFGVLTDARLDWENTFGDIAYSVPTPTAGTTASQPTGLKVKFQYVESDRKEIVEKTINGGGGKYWPNWSSNLKPEYTGDRDNDSRLPQSFELIRLGKRAIIYDKLLKILTIMCNSSNVPNHGFQEDTSSTATSGASLIRPVDQLEVAPQDDISWIRRELLEKLFQMTISLKGASTCEQLYEYSSTNKNTNIKDVEEAIKKSNENGFTMALLYADNVASLFMIDKLVKSVDALRFINQGELTRLATSHALQLILSNARVSSPDQLQQLYEIKKNNVFAVVSRIGALYAQATNTTNNPANEAASAAAKKS